MDGSGNVSRVSVGPEGARLAYPVLVPPKNTVCLPASLRGK